MTFSIMWICLHLIFNNSIYDVYFNPNYLGIMIHKWFPVYTGKWISTFSSHLVFVFLSINYFLKVPSLLSSGLGSFDNWQLYNCYSNCNISVIFSKTGPDQASIILFQFKQRLLYQLASANNLTSCNISFHHPT